MKYTKPTCNPTDTTMLSQVYSLYSHLGHMPSGIEFKHDTLFRDYGVSTFHARFGNHHAMIAAVKYTYKLLSPAERAAIEPERQHALELLSKYYGDLEYWQPRSTYIQDLRIPDMATFARCCGGLDAALRELGLPVCYPMRADLIAALQYARHDLGYTPRLIDAQDKLCIYSYSAYLNTFETWNNALTAAGIPVILDQPNKRAKRNQQKYSFHRHPNQIHKNSPPVIMPPMLISAETVPSASLF